MKIFFIGDSYIPQNCGMTSVITYLAEGLSENGHDVTVIANDVKRLYPVKEEISNVKVVRFTIHRNALYQIYGNTSQLVNFIKESAPDVLIFEALASIPCDALIPYMSKLPGLKILHSHGNPAQTLKPFVFKNGLHFFLANLKSYLFLRWKSWFLYPDFIKNQDAVITLSNCCSDFEIVKKNAKRKVIIGNAVEDIFFSKNIVPCVLQIKHRKYIVSIASFSELKNQSFIVESYLKLKTRGVSLVLIGNESNSYYDKVKKLAHVGEKNNKDKEILMLTGVDRKFFPYILRNAYLYLIASKKEEFSISLIEAMASGLPFVSTNVGNAKELPGGIVVNNEDDMPGAIDTILSDEYLHNKMAKENLSYARTNFRKSVAVISIENLINSLKS